MQHGKRDLIGQVLADTYQVESLIGEGGMGAVYAARHLRLPMRFAIKVLHGEAAANPEIFARFRREAEIASSLRHPNIVQVLDFNHLADGTPYLVMEFLDGEDLGHRLRRVGRMSYPEVVALARAIGGGLMAAHKREVVHRDLKPANIFLCRHEQGDEVLEVPKIVDFGISKIRHAAADTQQTKDQQLLGTPNYMSPEQARGENSRVDHRTDQWALAAILYQCLTGRLAFPGDTLASVIYQVVIAEPPPLHEQCPDLPQAAEAAIRRALCKTRDERFGSILDFVKAFCGQPLAGQLGAEPTTPLPTPPGGGTPVGNTPLGLAATPPVNPPTPPPGGSGAVIPATGSGQRMTSIGPGRQPMVPVLVGLGVVVLLAGGAAVGLRGWKGRATGPGPTAPSNQPIKPVPEPVKPVPEPVKPVPEPVKPVPEPVKPAEILVRVEVTPADARVFVGAYGVGEDGVVRMPRGSEAVAVRASAPGYGDWKGRLVPDADQTLSIKLKKARQRPGGARPNGSSGYDETQDIDIDISGSKK